MNRLEKRRGRVLRIYRQPLIRRPAVLRDELHKLRRAEAERIGPWAKPDDLQRQCLTAFADPFAEQRQSVSGLHPRSPVNIADIDGARFGPVIIAGVENPHSPRPEFFSPFRRRMSLEPTQARGSKAAQPVVLINRLGRCSSARRSV